MRSSAKLMLELLAIILGGILLNSEAAVAAIVPLNCPAFRSEVRQKKPAEGAASFSPRQAALLAAMTAFAWALVLGPLLLFA